MKNLPLDGHAAQAAEATATEPSVTELLLAWSEGDTQALDLLAPQIYDELHRLARHYMRGEREFHVLQTTALIHEAYLRLIDLRLSWQDRNHFFAVAARVMRRVLTDLARKRDTAKRGAGQAHLPLNEEILAENHASVLVALDDSLKELETADPRKGRIVELRYYGGLSIAETAEALGLSRSTVDRELKMAKAWLSEELRRYR